MSLIGVCSGQANGTPHEEICFCLCNAIEEGRTAASYCPMCNLLNSTGRQLEDLTETVERLMAERS